MSSFYKDFFPEAITHVHDEIIANVITVPQIKKATSHSIPPEEFSKLKVSKCLLHIV